MLIGYYSAAKFKLPMLQPPYMAAKMQCQAVFETRKWNRILVAVAT